MNRFKKDGDTLSIIDDDIIMNLSTATSGQETTLSVDDLIRAKKMLIDAAYEPPLVIQEVHASQRLIDKLMLETQCNVPNKEKFPSQIYGMPLFKLDDKLLPEGVLGLIKIGGRIHALIKEDGIYFTRMPP